ncbi:MAG: hypothetical protein GWP59_07125 [Chlamydiales bacterium]|nr:hypothetical protein [Chlamydiales bacterium]
MSTPPISPPVEDGCVIVPSLSSELSKLSLEELVSFLETDAAITMKAHLLLPVFIRIARERPIEAVLAMPKFQHLGEEFSYQVVRYIAATKPLSLIGVLRRFNLRSDSYRVDIFCTLFESGFPLATLFKHLKPLDPYYQKQLVAYFEAKDTEVIYRYHEELGLSYEAKLELLLREIDLERFEVLSYVSSFKLSQDDLFLAAMQLIEKGYTRVAYCLASFELESSENKQRLLEKVLEKGIIDGLVIAAIESEIEDKAFLRKLAYVCLDARDLEALYYPLELGFNTRELQMDLALKGLRVDLRRFSSRLEQFQLLEEADRVLLYSKVAHIDLVLAIEELLKGSFSLSKGEFKAQIRRVYLRLIEPYESIMPQFYQERLEHFESVLELEHPGNLAQKLSFEVALLRSFEPNFLAKNLNRSGLKLFEKDLRFILGSFSRFSSSRAQFLLDALKRITKTPFLLMVYQTMSKQKEHSHPRLSFFRLTLIATLSLKMDMEGVSDIYASMRFLISHHRLNRSPVIKKELHTFFIKLYLDEHLEPRQKMYLLRQIFAESKPNKAYLSLVSCNSLMKKASIKEVVEELLTLEKVEFSLQMAYHALREIIPLDMRDSLDIDKLARIAERRKAYEIVLYGDFLLESSEGEPKLIPYFANCLVRSGSEELYTWRYTNSDNTHLSRVKELLAAEEMTESFTLWKQGESLTLDSHEGEQLEKEAIFHFFVSIQGAWGWGALAVGLKGTAEAFFLDVTSETYLDELQSIEDKAVERPDSLAKDLDLLLLALMKFPRGKKSLALCHKANKIIDKISGINVEPLVGLISQLSQWYSFKESFTSRKQRLCLVDSDECWDSWRIGSELKQSCLKMTSFSGDSFSLMAHVGEGHNRFIALKAEGDSPFIARNVFRLAILPVADDLNPMQDKFKVATVLEPTYSSLDSSIIEILQSLFAARRSRALQLSLFERAADFSPINLTIFPSAAPDENSDIAGKVASGSVLILKNLVQTV